MFASGMKDIIHQEMIKERDKLEKHIVAMEESLRRARAALIQSDRPTQQNHRNIHDDTLKQSYTQWDCYEDTDELDEKIDAAKKALIKLNAKVKNHNKPSYNNNNSNSDQCSLHHRYKCSCLGDKRAERAVVAMKTCERLDEMSQFKKDGNTLFVQQNYKEALALYEKSLMYYEYCFDGSQDERKQAETIRELCLVNAAACFLHLKLYRKCIEYCDEALAINDNNVKAWFRRGRAHRLQHDFDSAEEDLKKARQLLGGESTLDVVHNIEREMKVLIKDRRRYKESASKLASSMIGFKV